MIRLARDGMIVHHTGVLLGSWAHVGQSWQVWGGRRCDVLVAEFPTRRELVHWVEAHAVDGWGMVARIGQPRICDGATMSTSAAAM